MPRGHERGEGGGGCGATIFKIHGQSLPDDPTMNYICDIHVIMKTKHSLGPGFS